MVYKWCVVPQCTNTSIKNPEKLFVSVPTNPERRKLWLKLARRDPKSIVSHSNVFMCEDHFVMEKTVANYMQYKIGLSKKLLLYDKAVPTKFYCQDDRERPSDEESSQKAFLNRQQIIKECLLSHLETQSENLQTEPEESPKTEDQATTTDATTSAHKSVQALIKIHTHYRRKSVQTELLNKSNAALESETLKQLKQRFLCEDHFKPEDMHKLHSRNRLLLNAVPVMFTPDSLSPNAASQKKNADSEPQTSNEEQRDENEEKNEYPAGALCAQCLQPKALEEKNADAPPQESNEDSIGESLARDWETVEEQPRFQASRLKSLAQCGILKKAETIRRTIKTTTDNVEPVKRPDLPSRYFPATPTSKTIKVLNVTVLKKIGPCRCCLKEGSHSVVDMSLILEPLNIVPRVDPRVSALACSDCTKFLQEAKIFRDMAAASEKALFDKLHQDKEQPTAKQSGLEKTVQDGILLKKTVNIPQPTKKVKLIHRNSSDEKDPSPPRKSPTVPDVPEPAIPANKRDEMDFSDLSDTESVLNAVPKKVVTSRKMLRKRKIEKRQFKIQNMTTILENSTLTPFGRNNLNMFTCIYCKASYNNFEDLKQHIETHDKGSYDLDQTILRLPEGILRADISNLKCKLCDERFTNVDTLVDHLVIVHDKIYNYVASNPPHCIESFDLSSGGIKCTVCGQCLSSYNKLFNHVNVHYGSHLCEQCGARFVYKIRLNKHKMDHKREQTHIKCDFCGKECKNKRQLIQHRANHKPPTGRRKERIFKEMGLRLPRSKLRLELTETTLPECKICSERFSSVEELFRHRIKHLRSSKEKIHKCELCGFVTPSKQYIREHLRRHWGVSK